MRRHSDSSGDRIDLSDPADVPARDWAALAAACANANLFYERDALLACTALPDAAPPRVLCWWRGDELSGLLPLAVRRVRGVALCIENWDQRVRALGDPLIRRGSEHNFWRAALPVLERQPGQYLRFSALDAEGAAMRALAAVLAEAGRPWYRTRDYGRAVLHAGLSSAEHAAAHVRGKVLKEHRRLRARLADRGALIFDRLAPNAPAAPWIDQLFALEETGWKGREGVAAAADPATERCFRTLLEAEHARGTLDFHRMRVGDATIAMLANLERGTEAFQIKIAYDEAWASFSPGVLIEMEYLAYALDRRGLARVDSCARAGHPMIDRIWPDRRRIVSLAVPFDNPLSRFLCHAGDRWRARKSAPVATGEPA